MKKFGEDKFSLIKNRTRIGLQKIANWVFKNTRAPYVIRLDADDFWMPHILETLHQRIIENPNAALAFGSFIYISDDNQELTEEKSVNYLNRFDSGLDAPHGACTLVDREKFLNEGLYFENVNAQDGWDLWLKCFPKYEFIPVNEPLFYYRQHSVSLSKNHDRILRARRKLMKLNLKKHIDEKTNVLIPIAKHLNLNDTQVSAHIKELIGVLYASSYSLNPILTFDDFEQLKFFEALEISVQTFCTENLFKHGMNPFKLIEVFDSSAPTCWLNFNTSNIDCVIIDAAFDTFYKLNLDICVSVIEQREPVYQLTKNGLNQISQGRYSDLKLKAEELWRMNNILVISNGVSNRTKDEYKTGFFEMTSDESKLIHDW